MLYIKLPENARFEQREINREGELQVRDHIIINSEKTETLIDLQDIVKDLLQHKQKGVKSVEINDGIIIYFRKPPYDDQNYLEYDPNRNGKLASNKVNTIIGHSKKPYNPAEYTKPGSRWVDYAFFTEDRREDQLMKDRKTQENKRHTGDNPKAT